MSNWPGEPRCEAIGNTAPDGPYHPVRSNPYHAAAFASTLCLRLTSVEFILFTVHKVIDFLSCLVSRQAMALLGVNRIGIF